MTAAIKAAVHTRADVTHIGGLPVQKQMCNTCPWQTNGHSIELKPGRLQEIQAYLRQGTTHQCHSIGPDGVSGRGAARTCRGSVTYMASQGIVTEQDRVQRIIQTLSEPHIASMLQGE